MSISVGAGVYSHARGAGIRLGQGPKAERGRRLQVHLQAEGQLHRTFLAPASQSSVDVQDARGEEAVHFSKPPATPVP